MSTSLGSNGIVVVKASGLGKVIWDGEPFDVFSSNQWAGNKGHEHNEHDEIEDSIADYTSLPQFRLLQGIDWRSDLTTWAQPEEHDRVDLVDHGNQESWKHDEEENVSEDEIACEVAQLGDFAKELAAGLRYAVPTHAVPFASPPSNVGRVRLEFTSQGQADNEFVNKALNREHCDHTKKGLGKAEAFEEEHDFEECE